MKKLIFGIATGIILLTISLYPQSNKFLLLMGDDVANIEYEISSTHLAAWRGNKVFKNNDATKFYLSEDYGTTYPDSLTINGFSYTTFSYIFPDGDIIWSKISLTDKLLISKDNLATYDTVVVLAVGGDSLYTPSETGEDYKPFMLDNYNDSGLLVWGNYTVIDGGRANVWYTFDGDTVYSAFEFGVSEIDAEVIDARHVHSVTYNPADTSWWVLTGDFTDECHWIKGTFDWADSTWDWTLIGSASGNSYYKSVAMFYYDGYMYWASDSDNLSKRGIYRCLYSNITDSTAFEKIYDTQYAMTSLYVDKSGNIIAAGAEKNIIITSTDRINFQRTRITHNAAITGAYNGLILARPTDYRNYYIAEFYEDTEEIYNYTKGQVALLRVNDDCDSPANVTNLSAVGDTAKITLSWDSPADIDSVLLFRGTSINPTTQITSLSPLIESYIDTPLAQSVVYYYRVKTKNICGLSDYSINVSDTSEGLTRTLGSELVTDTIFASAGAWNLGANWAIASNLLTGTSTTATVIENDALASLAAGDSVQVTVVVSSYTGGNFKVEIPNGVAGTAPAIASAGTHTFTVVFNDGNNQLGINAGISFTGSISKISARKVTWE